MSNVLIIDTVRYKPYNFATLATEGLGGSEASVLRLARALSHAHSVRVLNGQPGALEHDLNSATAVEFVTPETPMPKPDVVIHVRTGRTVPDMAAAYPSARQIVWHHDLGGAHTRDELPVIHEYAPDIVLVSEYHRLQFFDRGVKVYAPGLEYRGKVAVCNNIVDAAPDPALGYDPNQLIFPSSPHKGLKQTLALFEELKRQFTNLELVIANPGYVDTPTINQRGVRVLGTLPHAALVREVQQSFALFSANHLGHTAETFGLVYAEANAVGTPCIAHPLGALVEVLDARQLVDTRVTAKVAERLGQFKVCRPEVSGGKYTAEIVLAQWAKVIK